SRSLKFATDLRAWVITGFWPVIAVMSRTTDSITFELPLASLPQPTLTTILSIVGICIVLLYWNFFIRAGATSAVYLAFKFGTIYCNLLFLQCLAAVLAHRQLLAVHDL